ncbi:hypothetical protein M3Y97_00497300 [Aphelenchoides bicaudatus]|nr:hypothetical protein M3Y97_00497300 [Aphelenchoides bicaudatus]
MSNYKLTYFPGRGLTEASRLVLHYAEQKFEDLRLTHDQFSQLKNTFPNGQVPLLEVDGKKISQSGAILRFLARRFKLEGKDEFEAAKCDEVFMYFYDKIRAQVPYTLYLLGQTSGDKDKLHKEVFLPLATQSLHDYEKLLKEHSSGFVLKSGISYADFVVVEHLTTIFGIDKDLETKHPFLAKYVESIHSMPQIAKYVQGRPKSLV